MKRKNEMASVESRVKEVCPKYFHSDYQDGLEILREKSAFAFINDIRVAIVCVVHPDRAEESYVLFKLFEGNNGDSQFGEEKFLTKEEVIELRRRRVLPAGNTPTIPIN